MNSAMAISILGTLISKLDVAVEKVECGEKLHKLSTSIGLYRKRILEAFLMDMGDRSFSRRMYFNHKSYGDENMFLEPQGFTLQISELPVEWKKALYREMKKRVYAGEKFGSREQECPEFEDERFDKGSRENGGFWWALNGPVIVGVSQFDKEEAHKLLKNMTLHQLV